RTSMLAEADGATRLREIERDARAVGLTIGLDIPNPEETISDFLARGAHGLFDPWHDPADHLVAGFEAVLANEKVLVVRPAPRRAVGPDLFALVFGMQHRFAKLTRAWLRLHAVDARRPRASAFAFEPTALAGTEAAWLDRLMSAK
ncbi:MAG: FAD-binding oxidoreductase, partial [Polyangiaceae bacterium]